MGNNVNTCYLVEPRVPYNGEMFLYTRALRVVKFIIERYSRRAVRRAAIATDHSS